MEELNKIKDNITLSFLSGSDKVLHTLNSFLLNLDLNVSPFAKSLYFCGVII